MFHLPRRLWLVVTVLTASAMAFVGFAAAASAHSPAYYCHHQLPQCTTSTTTTPTTTTVPPVTPTTYTTVPVSGSTADVSTSGELSAALAAATPGEIIQLAAGTYSGKFVTSQSGTAGDPITLTGPSTAILDAGETTSGYTLHLLNASWWNLTGFSVIHGQKAVMLDGADHDILNGLNVSLTGDEAVHFRTYSSYDIIENSDVHDTGSHDAKFGEGIYIGSAVSNWGTYTNGKPDMSNYDEALNNTIYNTTAENIDVKEGTTGGIIEGNHFNGTGSSAAYTWIDVKGNSYTVDNNTGVHGGSEKTPDGLATFVLATGYGNDNVFHGNKWNFAPATGRYGFFIDGGSGNVVGCDNTVVGATSFANVTCVK